jgi:predicted MFS family arabinose efflux permease
MLVRAVALLSFAGFASILSLRASDPLLPMMGMAFGILPGAAAVTITAFGIGYGVFQLVHGPLGDRIGKFRLLSYLAALSAVGSFACAIAPGLGTLIAARFFTGAMTGGMIPLAMAWIGDTVPYDKRQVFIARYLLGNFMGITIGPLIAGYMAEFWGWRSPFYVIGVLYVVITVVFWHELRSNAMTRSFTPSPHTLPEAFRAMFKLLQLRKVRVILRAVMANGAFMFAPVSFIPLHGQLHLGMGTGESTQVLIAYALGGITFALGSGYFVRRLGERGLLLAGSVCLIVGWWTMLMLHSPVLGMTAMFVAGLGTFAIQNVAQVHGTQMAPEARGAAMALFACCLFVVQSLAVGLWGTVVDHFGTTPVFVICSTSAACMTLLFRHNIRTHEA